MRPFASLRRSAEFAWLRRHGRRAGAGSLTLYQAEAEANLRRSLVGISVGKPVGTAVARNRVRRRVAAILDEALTGRRMRLLVVARPGAATVPFAALRRDLVRALDQ